MHDSDKKQSNDAKENEVSAYSSPSQDHDSEANGSPSITSNIRKLIEGKIDILTKANSFPSHSHCQDTDYWMLLKSKGLIQIQCKLIQTLSRLFPIFFILLFGIGWFYLFLVR